MHCRQHPVRICSFFLKKSSKHCQKMLKNISNKKKWELHSFIHLVKWSDGNSCQVNGNKGKRDWNWYMMGCLGKSRKVKRIHCFCFYVALGLFSLLHSSVLAFFHQRTAILISTLIGCYWLWEERREIFVSIHLGQVCEKSLKKFDFQYCCKEWRDWNKEKNRENVTANKESSALFKMHCCRGMSPDQSYICQVL